MSTTLDAAAKVHGKQLEAVAKSQDIVVKATQKVAGVVDGFKAKAPAQLTGPLEKITAPIAKVVGKPSDYATYFVNSTKDWAAAQQKFQSAVFDALRSNRGPVSETA